MVLACCGAIMPCGTSIITGTTPGPFLAETAGPSHPKAQERTQFTDSERFRFGTRKSNRHSEERQSGQPDPRSLESSVDGPGTALLHIRSHRPATHLKIIEEATQSSTG